MATPFHTGLSGVALPPDCRFLEHRDGRRIRLATWSYGSAGTVFIFTGRTEYIEKYGRIINEMLIRNLSVVIWDWRGQGLSTRIDPERNSGHVSDFSEYQRDVDLVMQHCEGFPAPLYMLGHSMGGAIGLHSLARDLGFERAVFSAPMWDIALPGPLKFIARGYGQFASMMSGDTWLAPGQVHTPYVLTALPDDNVLTSDAPTFTWMQDHIRRFPELGLGGPSVGWISAALDEINMLELAPKPDTPILCLYGTKEEVVSIPAIRAMVNRLPNASAHAYEGARHEIFMERPDVLHDATERTLKFFGV